MFKKSLAAFGLMVASALPAAAAITVDYTNTVSSVESQVSSALTAVLPIFGTLLAVGVGVKFFKRFVKSN